MTPEFSELVTRLSPALRDEYERLCGAIDGIFQSAGAVNFSSLDRLLRAREELRSFTGVYALKLWLERTGGKVSEAEGSAAFGVLGFVLQDRVAAAEVWRWVEELNLCEVPREFRDRMPTELSVRLDQRHRVFVIPADRFEFVRQLNSRGMATVLLVRHRGLDQQQVLKALHPELRDNPTAANQFRAEARLLLQAAGPGIVRVIDCADSEGWPYFTMEFYPGGSLAERLVEGPMSQVQAAEQIAVIARSLHAVHRTHGLVHRDIKPANIFYLDGGRPALGDFGLARRVDTDLVYGSSPRRMPILGTRGYIAPEIIDQSLCIPGEDDLQIWKRADVFSLGVTLYQCLTGRLPYQTGEGRQELDGVLNNELVRSRDLARVDVVLDAICTRAIRKQPGQRFSSAQELAEELEKWVVSNSREPMAYTPASEQQAVPQAPPVAGWKTWFKNKRSGIFTAGVFTALTVFLAVVVATTRSGGQAIVKPGDERTEPEYPPPAEPTLTPEEARLRKAGWSEKAARELAQVATPILKVISTTDAKFAENTWVRLQELQKRVPDVLVQNRPHMAAALIQPSFFLGQDQQLWMEMLEDSADSGLIDDLLVRFADPDLLPELVRMLHNYKPVLRSLRERDWIGGEQLLRELPDDEAGRTYGAWLGEILRMSDQQQCLEMLAVAMLHGRSTILPLLQSDPAYRADFLSRIWPAFRDLTNQQKDRQKRFSFYAQPLCWSFLQMEQGQQVLELWGPGLCDVFVGEEALPEAAHRVAAELLLERRKAALECLSLVELRRSSEFTQLLSRKLSTDEFAALCALLLVQKSDGFAVRTASRLAALDDGLIRHELDAAPPGFLDRTPVVYVKLGWKLFSGERVYPDEWARVFIQGLKDAATIASSGASTAITPMIEGFQAGLEIGNELVQQARFALLAKIRQNGSEQVTREELNKAFPDPEDLVRSYLGILGGMQKSIDSQRSQRVFDTRHVRQFFLSASLQPRQGKVTVQGDVSFLRIRTGDNFVACLPQVQGSLASRDYHDYLSERTRLITEASPEPSVKERTNTIRQLLFAWLLLNHPEAAGFVKLSAQGDIR
ncbi:MAG: serine/threonine-protein kinase, partial [Planctomycetia bacterium]